MMRALLLLLAMIISLVTTSSAQKVDLEAEKRR